MPRYLENLDEAMEEIAKSSVGTSQGSFIRVEDVRRIMERRTKEIAEMRAEQPKPRTFNDAKQQAMRDPELKEALSHGPQEPGRAVSAGA